MKKIISLADVNEYYRQTDIEALRFLQQQQNAVKLGEEYPAFQVKNKAILQQRITLLIPPVLAIIGHLAAGAIEGITLAPLFKTMMKGVIGNEDMLRIVSYMPICIFWAMTLMIGYSLHQVNLRKDLVNPQKRHANWIELAKGLLFGSGYLFCLVQFTQIARDKLGDFNQPASVIFWVGIFELLLGYFSIIGWEIVVIHGRNYFLGKALSDSEKMSRYHAHRCEQLYMYYEQAWRYYNLMEGTNYPQRMNSRIRAALDYDKSPAKESTQLRGLEELEKDFMI